VAVRFKRPPWSANSFLVVLTFSITPRSVIVFVGGAAMAPSGNAAPIAAIVFFEHRRFHCVFLSGPRAYWARCLPAPLASPVPVSACEHKLFKINFIHRRRHPHRHLAMVTKLPGGGKLAASPHMTRGASINCAGLGALGCPRS
jgi:hypothetical protein